MKLPPSLERSAYHMARRMGYHYVFPQMSYAEWVADLICWYPGKGILEIEIKRNWADTMADKAKTSRCRTDSIYNRVQCLWGKNLPLFDDEGTRKKFEELRDHSFWPPQSIVRPVTKWEWLQGEYPCGWRPTHFVICAPDELAHKIAESSAVPLCFGVWAMDGPKGYDDILRRTRRLCKTNVRNQREFERAAFRKALNVMEAYYDMERQDEREEMSTRERENMVRDKSLERSARKEDNRIGHPGPADGDDG
jgi:hypothetical protein